LEGLRSKKKELDDIAQKRIEEILNKHRIKDKIYRVQGKIKNKFSSENN